MPRDLHRKLLSAALLFSEYRHVRTAHLSDPKLSPIGAHEANRLWIEERLPAVKAAIDEVRTRRKEAEASLIAKLTGPFTTPPEDAADIAMAQEIRTWLRSLPSTERTEAVGKLVNKGDLTALRAVLTAPSYLTGLEEAELDYIRDDAAKAADPERYAKLQSLRKAGEVAERAVEGVARLLYQEATASPPPQHSRPVAPVPVLPPPDPDTVAAISKLTDEALARQSTLSAAA